jgi:hypothetical protein
MQSYRQLPTFPAAASENSFGWRAKRARRRPEECRSDEQILSNINDQTIAMLLPAAARAGRGVRGIRRIALITADRSPRLPPQASATRSSSGKRLLNRRQCDGQQVAKRERLKNQ